MKVAALYDVHGMPWALEAVLAEVDADAIVFGGDVTGGPSRRRRSTHRARRRSVRGNCDGFAEDWDEELDAESGWP